MEDDGLAAAAGILGGHCAGFRTLLRTAISYKQWTTDSKTRELVVVWSALRRHAVPKGRTCARVNVELCRGTTGGQVQAQSFNLAKLGRPSYVACENATPD